MAGSLKIFRGPVFSSYLCNKIKEQEVLLKRKDYEKDDHSDHSDNARSIAHSDNSMFHGQRIGQLSIQSRRRNGRQWRFHSR
jgi:hypothetical protein